MLKTLYHKKNHCLNHWHFPIHLDDQKENRSKWKISHSCKKSTFYCTINSTIFKYKIEEHFRDKIEVESHLGVGNGLVPAVILADESQYLWHLPTL